MTGLKAFGVIAARRARDAIKERRSNTGLQKPSGQLEEIRSFLTNGSRLHPRSARKLLALSTLFTRQPARAAGGFVRRCTV